MRFAPIAGTVKNKSISVKFLEFQEPFYKKVLGGSRAAPRRKEKI